MTQDVGVINAIIAVFEAILGWIVEAIGNIVPLFYVAETGLTFLGVLAVAGLVISIFFLLMAVIQNFLHFRG